MGVQVEKLENSMVKLTIEVPETEFEKALQDAYNKQKNKINMPGFRKGKVPRAMIEKMYGPEVFYNDAADAILPEAYYNAAQESGENIVSRPVVDIVQMEKGKAFIFTAEVAVKPPVELGAYKGIEVTGIDADVDDDEVMIAIDEEREQNARTIDVEDRPIKKGDIATIDFEGFIDGEPFDGGKGENHPLEIGSDSFIPGFEDQLIGKNVGDETEINVKFPADYHMDDLKGKDAVFKVKIHEVKEKELPELDDEFAQDVSEFDTVEEYKESVREGLIEKKKSAAKGEQEEEALEKIVEASVINLPDAMVLTRCDEMINQFGQQLSQQGISLEQYLEYTENTMEQLRESVRPEAEQRIKSELVLEAIADAEEIEVTEDDIEKEIQSMSELYNMDIDRIRSLLGEEQMKDMKLELASRKALEVIYANLVFTEPSEEEAEEAAAEDTEEIIADAVEAESEDETGEAPETE